MTTIEKIEGKDTLSIHAELALGARMTVRELARMLNATADLLDGLGEQATKGKDPGIVWNVVGLTCTDARVGATLKGEGAERDIKFIVQSVDAMGTIAEDAARAQTIEECAKLCADADKSTHPSDLADLIRAKLQKR
jgi:hypothetical protein